MLAEGVEPRGGLPGAGRGEGLGLHLASAWFPGLGGMQGRSGTSAWEGTKDPYWQDPRDCGCLWGPDH